ncbi:hypothetical protein AVEN_93342-1 [Araneus ventricosus]|uniref:Uncharacterized protein n=1 Tax=Araneus ventricosus TaxID=182803 RepID=A0A4Y2NIA1_ARAVE|nr:hypothetical protein AVEN_93342-1 [Araneus ventricosus]
MKNHAEVRLVYEHDGVPPYRVFALIRLFNTCTWTCIDYDSLRNFQTTVEPRVSELIGLWVLCEREQKELATIHIVEQV